MPTVPVASWLVPLEGDLVDLEELPMWLANEEIRVVERDGTYNLLLPAELTRGSYEPVLALAEQYIRFANGAGRLLDSSFRPVSVVRRVFGLAADGKVIHTVICPESGEVRVKGGTVGLSVGGQDSRDPRLGAAAPYFRSAVHLPRARDALILIGQKELSWADLYLIFDLVQAEVGGAMYDNRWISKANAELFTQTANSYSTLGLEGRHGKDRGTPPPIPMEHAEAVRHLRGLLRSWLACLADSSPPTQAS